MYVHPDKIYGNNRYSKLIPADREGKDTKHDAKKSRKDNTHKTKLNIWYQDERRRKEKAGDTMYIACHTCRAVLA